MARRMGRLDGFITRAVNSWMRYLNQDQKENLGAFTLCA